MTTDLRQLIEEARSRDRPRLKRRLARLEARGAGTDDLRKRIEQSVARVNRRRQQALDCTVPDQLPIAAQAERISALLGQHQVLIVAGETGSGKSTQLPKICLAAGRGSHGTIAHTQPRRVAARSVAARIAEETQTELGASIGYRVRFSDQSSEQSRLVLMTDGLLLAEIRRDPLLLEYDTIIVDEAHERSLNIDFLVGCLKRLLPKRPDLKVIITSATIDVDRFSRHFNDAPIVTVEGRGYPVEIRYREMVDGDLPGSVLEVVRETLAEQIGGDVLVFLPGERDIRETARVLRQEELRHVEVLPLYARLSLAEQNRIFSAHTGTRVVLATNVAETSLTVPGIRFVIDTGLARISRYSVRSKVQRLPIEAVSRASADQRAGRCGRVGPGICYRLYSEEDYRQRSEFTDPEIRRTNLASVILQMLDQGLGDIGEFPFLDPPDSRQINDGFSLLADLRLIDGQRVLTAAGRQLAALPVDPRLATILLGGHERGCLREILVIAAALSVQDPRERPPEQRASADQAHARFRADDSDFLAWVNLWDQFEVVRQESGSRQQRNWCEKNFVHWMRMREWRDIHRQLRLAVQALGWRENSEPADYAAIHCALLQGFVTQVGARDPEQEGYLGERNRRFTLFPGSSLKRKSPKWVVAAEFLDTGRLFGVTCARVETDWIVEAAGHLLQREHHSPHYDLRRGQVICRERLTLRGLLVSDGRKVDYARIDPQAAHALFVRECLAEWNYVGDAPFNRHNVQMRQRAIELEAKQRRPLPLSDPEALYQFYLARVPESVCSVREFEKWRKAAEREAPALLFLDDSFLGSGESEEQFPDGLEWDGNRYPLSYRFEPGHERDGVVMQVPLALLHQVPAYLPEWIVPGMLREKCEAVFKALPKAIRRQLVPVPAAVSRVVPRLQPVNNPLAEALSQAIQRELGVSVAVDELQAAMRKIPPLYHVYFELIDERGRRLQGGRDLVALKRAYRERAGEALVESAENADLSRHGVLAERSGIVSWNFGSLPEYCEFERQGQLLRAWPGLVDDGDSATLRLFDSPDRARYATSGGVIRLLLLAARQQVRYLSAEIFRGCDLLIGSLGYPSRDRFVDDLLFVSAGSLISEEPQPADELEFEQLLNRVRGELVARTLELDAALRRAADLRRQVQDALDRLDDPGFESARRHVSRHVADLFRTGFIRKAGPGLLANYPRYLEAEQRRLERLPGAVARDAEHQLLLDDYLERLCKLKSGLVETMHFNRELVELEGVVEEWRISLFAQPMKTRIPVSAKRVEARLSALEAAVQELV